MTKAHVINDVLTLKINLINTAIERGYTNYDMLLTYVGLCDTIYKAVRDNDLRLLKSIDIGRLTNPVTIRIVGNAHYWAHTSN